MNALAATTTASAAPLVFRLAACLYPGGLLDATALPYTGRRLDKLWSAENTAGPADQALKRLACGAADEPCRVPLLLTGDQIYADATAGLFDPTGLTNPVASAYRRLRKVTWRTVALERSKSADVMCLMDDHEVIDNWEPSSSPERNADLLDLMVRRREAFLREQRGLSPANTQLWSAATLGPHPLFLGDTRSEREARSPEHIEQAQIMSAKQFEALKDFLNTTDGASPQVHKFVATPAIVLPRRLSVAESPNHPEVALRSDAWEGYPASLQALLAFLADQSIQRCVFLSGDEHLPCVAKATVQRLEAGTQPVSFWSVHAGALYAPYPFANSVVEDFVECETFGFQHQGRSYTCTVTAWFPPQPCAGFFEITTDPTASLGTSGLKAQWCSGVHATPDWICNPA